MRFVLYGETMSAQFASLSTLLSVYRRDNRWRSGRHYSRNQLSYTFELANAIANEENQ